MYLYGAGVTIPLFTGGRIDSAINIRKSQTEEKKLQLQQTVLEAVKEVEDNAASYVQLSKQHANLIESVDLAVANERQANELFSNGLAGLDAVLDNRLTVVERKVQEVAVRQRQLIALIQLYKALGGGWRMQAVQPKAQSGVN